MSPNQDYFLFLLFECAYFIVFFYIFCMGIDLANQNIHTLHLVLSIMFKQIVEPFNQPLLIESTGREAFTLNWTHWNSLHSELNPLEFPSLWTHWNSLHSELNPLEFPSLWTEPTGITLTLNLVNLILALGALSKTWTASVINPPWQHGYHFCFVHKLILETC